MADRGGVAAVAVALIMIILFGVSAPMASAARFQWRRSSAGARADDDAAD